MLGWRCSASCVLLVALLAKASLRIPKASSMRTIAFDGGHDPWVQVWLGHVKSMKVHFSQEWSKTLPADERYRFQSRWFRQRVDHVNKQHSDHFWQRYFVYEQFTETELDTLDHPLFVFCGAEQGDIYLEWQHFGFMLEVAREHGAKVLYLEHRFFGESKPYGDEAFVLSPARIGLLSMEQSVQDYAAIIRQHRGRGPVLTFGGSLSGTLAVMMRIRYPALVDMAFASSAPVLGVVGVADPFAWRKQLTDNFAHFGGADCPDLVRRGFRAFARRNEDNFRKAFAFCDGPLHSEHWDAVESLVWQTLEDLGSFPYPEHRSGIPLVCSQMRKVPEGQDEEIFAKLLNLGPDGRLPFKCIDPRILVGVAERPMPATLPSGRLAADSGEWAVGWSYMACTEVVHPIGTNGVTDMFPAYNWTTAGLSADCLKWWNVSPDPHYLQSQIPLKVKRAGSHPVPERTQAVAGHILFSFGTRDPWGTMVPCEGWADDVVVVPVPGGGHCSDLITPDTEDTEEMRVARAHIKTVLGKWLMEARPVRHMKIRPFGHNESATGLRGFGSGQIASSP